MLGGKIKCVCGKVPFQSKAKAMKALRRMRGDKRPRCVYRCLKSPYWHTTNQKPRL